MARRPFTAPPRWFFVPALAASLGLLAPHPAAAEVPVQRTFFALPSSNGHGSIFLDLKQARLTHFREHPFASEEPVLDQAGAEVWVNNQPTSVATRDLLFDAYFGLRANGSQAWLTGAPVDLDKSGYAPWQAGKTGGTGVAIMAQASGALELTEYFFAPRALAHAGFVMAMRVKNGGVGTATGVSAFSLHNFHLGYGRPGALIDLAANGETVAFDGAGGKADLLERAFAGVVVARPLATSSHHAASNPGSAVKLYDVVNGGGAADLPDLAGVAPTADDSVSGYQFDFGDLAPGDERWVGIAFAHHGDPLSGATAQAWLDAYVGGKGAQALVTDELGAWTAFQGGLTVPAGLDGGEETLLRQSAAMLSMAQTQEDSSFLREFLTKDGEPRYTRFGVAPGGPKATLPATIAHRAKGAVLASLPPGEWTVAWARDGAYSAVAMATLGMKDEARAALEFTLNAESGRFQGWNELKPYGVPPYVVSLVRYYGFGVEETDVNAFGPNLEFDGMGLFLWAAQQYEQRTGDKTLVDQSWPVMSAKIADVLLALVDPVTGLVRADSSIWESHWNGRQRSWTYTSITAARGLCDAATLADRVGDAALAAKYRDAGKALRAAIAAHLTDASHALASNAEELAAGEGYWDAAVLDGVALGLFDPKGKIAAATLAGLEQHLRAPAGAGWSRNDDRYDHAGGQDLSPWGGEYDSAEWVFTDMRGAVATRLAGDVARSDELIDWVRDQSLLNYLAVSETYDEGTGVYKFNAPMVGFGAGAFALALAARSDKPDPACGAYLDESTMMGSGGGGGSSTGAGGGASSGGGGAAMSSSGGPGAAGGASPGGDGGCGCHAGGSGESTALAAWLALGLALAARRRK